MCAGKCVCGVGVVVSVWYANVCAHLQNHEMCSVNSGVLYITRGGRSCTGAVVVQVVGVIQVVVLSCTMHEYDT